MVTGGDEVTRNMKVWAERQRGAVIALVQKWAGTLERRAKQNATWDDKSGNARGGLYGSMELRGLMRNEVIIKLGHSMEYGVFLELANDGRFAILKPTIDAAVPEIWKSYRRLWE